MKKILLLISTAIFFISCSPAQKDIKYVFYFIGDGMGHSHVSITESYLAYEENKLGGENLLFSEFPNQGSVSTYSANNFITCSAAAGTAMSTGTKTNNGYVGVDSNYDKLRSIAYDIKDAGYKVGILSTVTLDHATPAAFYANSKSRSNYHEIALQLADSKFDFFAGGGFIDDKGKDGNLESAYEKAEEKGYTIVQGMEEYYSKCDESEKILLLQEGEKKSQPLEYAIDQSEEDLNLSDLVTAAIDYLDNEDGFFIMAESGKIDWASHANDTKTAITEVIDFSNAIEVAYEFYERYPEETLIIVTADHETGGIGFGLEGVKLDYSKIEDVNSSIEKTNAKDYLSGRKEKKEVPNPGIGWTTGGHTGSKVPIYAIGSNSKLFGGSYDNTDIPKKILSIMLNK